MFATLLICSALVVAAIVVSLLVAKSVGSWRLRPVVDDVPKPHPSFEPGAGAIIAGVRGRELDAKSSPLADWKPIQQRTFEALSDHATRHGIKLLKAGVGESEAFDELVDCYGYMRAATAFDAARAFDDLERCARDLVELEAQEAGTVEDRLGRAADQLDELRKIRVESTRKARPRHGPLAEVFDLFEGAEDRLLRAWLADDPDCRRQYLREASDLTLSLTTELREVAEKAQAATVARDDFENLTPAQRAELGIES